MFKLFLLTLSVYLISVKCDSEKNKDMRGVIIEGLGRVVGTKYWDGEFHEFYGIPYATIPTGRDRFRPPIPPTPWEKPMKANRALVRCQQVYYTDDPDEELELNGEEDCLVAHLMVPTIATETNKVPVMVIVHGGGFAGGAANMAKYFFIAKHDILVVAINYRVGALGFACLGTEEIPGNAALRDIIASLQWVQKYIKYFGGDPNNVTLYGYSVGATLAELVALSPKSKGLFHKLILDSGSALSPFAIDRDPVSTAKNIAISIGYKDFGDFDDLNDFLLDAPLMELQGASRNFFLKNSTFGFAPCIEKSSSGVSAVIPEDPINVLRSGKYGPFSLIMGFAKLEGISRTSQFANWSIEMNDNFAEFVPADLDFKTDVNLNHFIEKAKEKYFGGKKIDENSLENYIDYFSDAMFKYGIMRSLKLHAEHSVRPIYLYEFSYIGKLNTKHYYMDKILGASHRDQTAYILDFYDYTRNYTDMDLREKMITMWVDFAKYENPTAYESSLLGRFKWLKYTLEQPYYLNIDYELKMKQGLFEDSFEFWDGFYNSFYWPPTPPDPKDYKINKRLASRRLKKIREEEEDELPPPKKNGKKSTAAKDDKKTPSKPTNPEKIAEKPPSPTKSAEKTPTLVKNTQEKPPAASPQKEQVKEQVPVVNDAKDKKPTPPKPTASTPKGQADKIEEKAKPKLTSKENEPNKGEDQTKGK